MSLAKVKLHGFALPDLGKAPDVEIWPRPELTPEAFVEIAQSKGATYGHQCYRLDGTPIWRAMWHEGGCKITLHGPECAEARMKELRA